jgi:uncharacterized protein YfaS (alpha-2-macroglobulin family)
MEMATKYHLQIKTLLMKMLLRLSFLLICTLLFNSSAFSQKYTIDDFYKVDSIANKAKPKDALALIEKMNAQAREDGNSPLLIKAVIYKMIFQSYLEENAFDKILADLRKDISLAKQPEKSILQSLLAETYWKFYQQNQWKISQRTNVSANIGDDINTWSIAKLTEETTKNYLASLTETKLLQNTKVDFLDNVLAGDKYNRSFRPTLYDLLAHRALDVFVNSQLTLTQAETENIDFNDTIWYADRKRFINTNLPQSDSTTFNISALQIFKNLISFHTYGDNSTALADVDLRRMKFIYTRNNGPENQELYYKALQSLANKTESSEVYADILYELALIHKNGQLPIDTNKQNLVKSMELINKAIKAFPKSIGAKNAENLAKQIKGKELSTKIRQYNLPNKPAQIYFSYKNVDTIYLKLYKKSLEDNPFYNLSDKQKFLQFLAKRKSLKEWFIVVPKSNDYQNHTLVDKIEGLPYGNYIIIATNTKLNEVERIYTSANFGVTSLNVNNRFVGDTTRQYFITNNANGNPIKGVKIKQYKNRYNESPIAGTEIFTDQDGFAAQEQVISAFDRAIISLGKDSVAINLETYRYNYRNYNDDDDDDEKKVILFTDRPIYRPGQVVYYKGLLLAKGRDKNRIVVNENVSVAFRDVNRKDIEKIEVTTNEYGTFQGSFIIPLGKLNGRMEINTAYGSIEVQVEEYKRPTFEIVFDKPNQQYKLNDSIKVQGKAASFSGYTIANAKVSYKIFRRAIYDYSLDYMQQTALYGSQAFVRTQVAIGKTNTKNDGKFELTFLAKAPNSKLNYTFDIEAEITDINGETRTKSSSINIGKKDIQLSISASQVLFLSLKPDSISFNVANLNGEPIMAKVKAEWSILQSPTRLMNKSPFYAEKYTLNKEEWLKTFPDDDYNNELELAKWSIRHIQYHQDLTVNNGNGELNFSSKNLIPGYYKIKLTAINSINDTVSIDKYLIVQGQEPQKIETKIELVVPELNAITRSESAIFRVAGLANNTKGYYEVYYKNTIVEKVWLNLSPKQSIIKIKPRDNWEDGFAVQFSMVYNGTVYNYLEHVHIIDRQKQLDIKFLTFRNKLQPGEKESWKLQISNKNGEKQMAEMVATLYDASLDDLRKMDWNRSINSTFSYSFYAWAYRANDVNDGSDFWFLRSYGTYYSPIIRTYENLNLFGYGYYGGYNNGYQNYIRRIQSQPKKGISLEATKKLAELEKGKTVYGIVFDFEGYAVPGAMVKAGKSSTVTNNFGVYALDAKTGEELTVTFIGFKTAKVKIGQKKRLDVTLQSDGSSLSEVVITSYGTSVSRKEVTGSVSTIVGSEQLKIRGSSSLDGKVAGVSLPADMVSRISGKEFVGADTLEFKATANGPGRKLNKIIPRTNFNESAFFYPQLKTDENGQINIEFTIPQSLTRYKMMGFAHTKDLKTASINNELVTQKQLAISANAPRFFREGDTILFSAKLNNLSGKKLNGDAYLELKNALTGKVIQVLAIGNQLKKDFTIENGGNEVLKWPLIIPSGISAISYKVVAQAGKFSDGEEMTIPVLPNSMLVTESMPINVRGNTNKTFNMEKLINSGSSKTMRNQALTFEFTSNPIWYAVQALPYLMEYPYECAEQTFSRFYANSFATGIINSSPKIKEIFNQWQNMNNGEALLSNLEKNPELKSILLEETPWVRNANNETERKKRLAALFDLNRMTNELKSNFEKLEKMQYNDGSFPWFTGMDGNRYITQHIVLGIGQLKKLKLIDEKTYPTLNTMLNKAIIYLDKQLVKDYKDEIAGKHFGYMPLHYLFARSYTNQINNNTEFVKAKDYYLKRITANWKTFDTYQLGQTALVLHRNGNKIEPAKIITLLKQTAQQSDEMGMYWANNRSGWWWYQSPIETQSLLIEAFDEVASDSKSVEEMKIWLLKNKQTNDWKTTKATAAACYALLMKGYDLLTEAVDPEITIGNKTIADLGFAHAPKEAGTGYQKITITGADVKPEMGKVEVKNNNKTIAWGALYWQYFEQLDKITPANTGVKIKKQLFIQNSTTKGNILTPLTSTNVLTSGDLVKVRIEIYSDRDMEYVHLKDMRSSGFEPVNVISQYKYQDGLGYYESTKDASTNFFIGYLRKGTYVFEYALRVTHSGNFSNGITSLQCMYAPEFTTHSEGIRVTVK